MEARIYQFPNRMREIPTQEIHSIYEDLYLEQIRQQNLEKTMIDLHDKMHPEIEFDYRLRWLVVLPFWGIIAFLIGYGLGHG